MKAQVLRFLRVRERPDPPPGDERGIPDPSLKTFRASRRDLWYHFFLWIPGQVMSFIGLVLSFLFLRAMKGDFGEMEGLAVVLQVMSRLSERFIGIEMADSDIAQVFFFLEVLAAMTFVIQFLTGGFLLKLSWELRWYMVGEEFLRIREGLWKVREQTVKIANIQNMTVKQGPIQRLFGIADLEIRTAGGGSSAGQEMEHGSTGLHVARFRGIEDVHALRDRLRTRLNLQRDAGLGEAMEPEQEAPPSLPNRSGETAAARELAREARELRRVLERSMSVEGGSASAR